MKSVAAINREHSKPLEIGEIDVDDPQPNEVMVKVVASGICHTDFLVRDGIYPTALPAVAGHEGAGIVEKIGSNVTTVVPGDYVIMAPGSCGVCKTCRKGKPSYCVSFETLNINGMRLDGSVGFNESGNPVSSHFYGQSSFSQYTLANERSVVKVAGDVPIELLGPLGCGMETGAGSIINSLAVRAGESVAVFGAGSVGSAAIMAAKLVGANTIIAVDLSDQRLEFAQTIGATHTINSSHEDLFTRVTEITGGEGVDASLNSTASGTVTRQAADILGALGRVGTVAAPPSGAEVTFEVGDSLLKGWTFKNIVQGDSVYQSFIPELVEHWRAGRFPIDKLVTYYELTDINRAFDDIESGATVKAIVRMPQ
ncbi:NAD(P)-dependent alcohol dehydrogenase [Brevibacterium metallidurans]|uniref:NAD(P)-dependent alcohol dehydrogenase n=1 Tax=Brevibacterium metallidurans TaxID=1482676 RepID=A0ABP3CBY9_9MICO